MGKKDRELMAQQREQFIKGCKANKVEGRKAERIWDLIEKFAGYGFNKCLTADTLIEMADGTRKLITEIRDGDRVLTKDGAFRVRGVRPSGVRSVGRLTLANGMAVRCTPDHPIFTQRGWVNAEALAAGDFVAVARSLPGRPGRGPLLAGGTVDVIPLALCRLALRDAIAKSFPSLKAGCRALGIAYRLMFTDEGKGGIRRDTLRHVAQRLDSPALDALANELVGWCRPRSFVREGEEPTYDFEVPVARSFLANGIAVHNSHAACYGVVAYQTAYLKANYPVEFMAALLTSEMDRTDKIVQYMEESRAMGLEIAPPDVNRSGARFTVEGAVLRFGLAAIKNVGESAIDSIVRLRQETGAFGSLTDFCARVDLRLLNRRVLESLIKAGAFDGFGGTRAGLLASLDQAMEAGQRRQRDREEGQTSLFDALGGASSTPGAAGAPAPSSPTAVPEWPAEQLLTYEKDVLGFYISGHPLERYRDRARELGTAAAADVASRPVGARVALLGQLSQVRERATKSGNRMAFAALDAVDGSVSLTIFPEALKACAAALHAPGPVIVKGRIDETDKGRVVLVEDIKPLEDALRTEGGYRPNGTGGNGGSGQHAHTCRIRVKGDGGSAGAGEALLGAVRALCEAYRGTTPLFLHVLLAEQEVVLKVPTLGVEPVPELVAKVEQLLGPGSIIVEYAGRA
jgi:hypothetical protein